LVCRCRNYDNNDNDTSSESFCKWDYTGQGFDYQILAGPAFIGIYTFAAIPIGIAADAYNRKVMFFKYTSRNVFNFDVI